MAMSTSQVGQGGSDGSRSQAILDFWFGSPSDPDSYGKEKPHWWSGMSSSELTDLDNNIREQFGADFEAAINGQLESWKNEPYSTLALILLLDQIPRNIYRGSPLTYSSAEQAVATAQYAVDHGHDQQLRLQIEKQFMYMPLLHSEDLTAQEKSIQLIGALNNPDLYKYSANYYEIIKKYGRFPHRNEILGRESTEEELEYLKSKGKK